MSRPQILPLALAPLCLAGCDMMPSTPPAANQVTAAAGPAGASAPLAPPPPVPNAVPPQNAPLRPAGTTMEHPDAESIALVYFSFVGGAPIADWVTRDVAASHPDEFARHDMEKQRSAQLKALADAAAKVGRFTLPVRSELSEYDERYGEYYVGLFKGGSLLSYDYRGQTYRIEFVNRDKAQAWKVPADEAKHIFERNGGRRDIVVTPTLEIVGFSPTGSGGSLQVKVLSYAIDSQSNDTRLGTVTVG